MSVVVS